MAEKFGRDAAGNFENFREGLPAKSAEEIATYSKEFWKKINQLENGNKYLERIEKGEAELYRLQQIEEAIKFKFETCVQ